MKDMHIWQLCHLAMVVPIADAYYEADNPKKPAMNTRLCVRRQKLMYQHSINAPDEMRELHKKFYEYMQNVINITEAESML